MNNSGVLLVFHCFNFTLLLYRECKLLGCTNVWKRKIRNLVEAKNDMLFNEVSSCKIKKASSFMGPLEAILRNNVQC